MAEQLPEGCGEPLEPTGAGISLPTLPEDPENQTPLIISTMSENGTGTEAPEIVGESSEPGKVDIGACPPWLLLLALVAAFFVARNGGGGA